MKPDDGDKGKNPNLAATLASIAIDTAKLITGVPLDYPDPLRRSPQSLNLQRKNLSWTTKKKSRWSIR
jgi:hypothetical protein